MFGENNFNGTAALGRGYSPVTLSHDWPKLSRLLLMLFCSCYGSTMNGFFVASFFVEHTLRHPGNVYLACVGLADLIITMAVTPVSAVVILSGQWDNMQVCKVLQSLSLTSTYSYSTYFAFVAVENFYRICRSPEDYAFFLALRIDLMCILVLIASSALAIVGVYLGFDYDYCERKYYGDYFFRTATTILFQAIPAIMTIICLFVASMSVKRRARKQIQYKRSQLYEREYSITAINITAYLIYIMAWTPYVVIVNEFPDISDAVYYNMITVGLFRSAITSSLYGIFNRSFRRAYAHLFNYCCCKSSLSGSFSNRHRRAMEYESTIGDVGVHIMHQAVVPSNPQRSLSYSRETQEL